MPTERVNKQCYYVTEQMALDQPAPAAPGAARSSLDNSNPWDMILKAHNDAIFDSGADANLVSFDEKYSFEATKGGGSEAETPCGNVGHSNI